MDSSENIKPCQERCTCEFEYASDRRIVEECFKLERVPDAFCVVKQILTKWPAQVTNFDTLITEVVYRYLTVNQIYEDLLNDSHKEKDEETNFFTHNLRKPCEEWPGDCEEGLKSLDREAKCVHLRSISLHCTLINHFQATNTFFAKYFQDHKALNGEEELLSRSGPGSEMLGLECLPNSLLDKTLNHLEVHPALVGKNFKEWHQVVGKGRSEAEEMHKEAEGLQESSTSTQTKGAHKDDLHIDGTVKMWLRRYVDNPQLLSFRLEGIVAAPLMCALSVLNEIDLFTLWVPHYRFPLRMGLKKATIVEATSVIDKIIKFDVDFPWPMANRDAMMEVWGVDDFRRNRNIVVKMSMCREDTYPSRVIVDEKDEETGSPCEKASNEESCNNRSAHLEASASAAHEGLPKDASKACTKPSKKRPRYRLLDSCLSPPSAGVERVVLDGAVVITPITSTSSFVQLVWHENPGIVIAESLINFAIRMICIRAFNRFRTACKNASAGIHADRRLSNRVVYSFVENRLKEVGMYFDPTQSPSASPKTKSWASKLAFR